MMVGWLFSGLELASAMLALTDRNASRITAAEEGRCSRFIARALCRKEATADGTAGLIS
jgi:hypothetical protein